MRSSSANSSASAIMRSISSSDRRPFSEVMVIFSDFPVPLSAAVTCRMPLESTSNVTSIWGTPRGAGGIPLSSNFPREWLSFVMGRSPSNTSILTVIWLSWLVEKIWDFLVGMVVSRFTIGVKAPPTVSMPRDRDVLSRSRMDSPPAKPPKIEAWTPAPRATASSGLMVLDSSFPPKNSESISWTRGMRVDPPTSTTWSTSDLSMSARFSTLATGASVFLNRSLLSSSKRARVSVS
mmetsp:Transcript_2321/g.6243  ORF Transcript_2321/g.6243 Transcript_2321/m.6243 type:complete len:236 (-) Transcript_2321:1148-1855(-)